MNWIIQSLNNNTSFTSVMIRPRDTGTIERNGFTFRHVSETPFITIAMISSLTMGDFNVTCISGDFPSRSGRVSYSCT